MKVHIGVLADGMHRRHFERRPDMAARWGVSEMLYQGVDKRPGNGLDVEWQVAMRPGQRRQAVAWELSRRRSAKRLRAKVEHPFLYIKRHFGYANATGGCPRTRSG